MDRSDKKIGLCREAILAKNTLNSSKNKKENKKSISKSTKALKNNANFGKKSEQEQSEYDIKNQFKKRQLELNIQKQSENDYGVSTFYTKYKVKTSAKRKDIQGNTQCAEYGEIGAFTHRRYESQHLGDQENSKYHEKINSLQKIKLPQNRGVINADGKFVSVSKEKHQKMHSFQNSYSSKHSLSLSKMLSMEKKRKRKSKSKNKDHNEQVKKIVMNKSAEKIEQLKKDSNKLGKKIQYIKVQDAVKLLHLKEKKNQSTNKKIVTIQSETQTCIQQNSNLSNKKVNLLTQISIQIQKQNQNSLRTAKKLKLSDHFLRERSQCVYLLSKICGLMSMKRQSLSLAVHYFDQYLLSFQFDNIKLVALSSLTLALKMDDAEMISRFCCEFMPNPERTVKKSTVKSKRKQLILKLQNKSKVAILLNSKIFEDNRKKEEFHLDQILDFQTNILLGLNFKLAAKSATYWVDTITFLWDFYIIEDQKQQNYDFLLFRNTKNSSNFSYLTQIIQAQSYLPTFYANSKCVVALTSLYLITRIRLQQSKQNIPASQLFKIYRTSLAKSSNLIFCDSLGINQLFGDFLQILRMSMANIIECAQQISKYLVYEAMNINDYSQIEGRNDQQKLSIHIHNSQIFNRFGSGKQF